MKHFQEKTSRLGLTIVAILTGALLTIIAPRLMAANVEANLIRFIDTSTFPAPDTSGIIYLPSENAFWVSDSEVNEMDIFQGFNIFKVAHNGTLLDSFSTLSPILFSKEPTGITINPLNNHCFISDDNYRAIFEINPGPDGLCLTADDSNDSVTKINMDNNFGSVDLEDVTYGLESLFLADGKTNKVYRLQPGPNGVFDNVLTGDDLVSSFDTLSLGLSDPEGIAFDPRDNTLFIVGSKQDNLIIHTTTDGILLRTIDISVANPRNPSGLALAPSSVDPSMTSLYMVVRGYDNRSYPDENDGGIYEFEIPPYSGNLSPVVSAGEDQRITLPGDAVLNGDISDDGLPNGILTSTWSKVSGPGEVSFTAPDSLNTTASFSMSGTYMLRLTANDGELSSFDNVSIDVSNGTSTVSVLSSRISASADDAEEFQYGNIALKSSDLEIGIYPNRPFTVGVRFTNIAIPENAIINKAYIQFKVDERSINNADITIHGESIANALGFNGTDYNISSRVKTSESIAWEPEIWDTIGAAGEEQRTPDLSIILQEIISETGWNSGNAMAFIFTGAGTRVAEAYDGDQAGAPLLYLEYITDPSMIAPVITLLGENPLNLNIGDSFSEPGATATDNPDGDITDLIQITPDDINTDVAATYEISYTVVDSDGNSASAIRNVIVYDSNNGPVITLIEPNPITLNIGDSFTDPGATAMDNEDGDITNLIQITPEEIDTTVAATYEISYTVVDSDGNSASALRSVIVVEPSSSTTILNVPDDYATIQDAISNAVDGDSIIIAPGTYQENTKLLIEKNNITIASRYLISGDENDIDTTIIIGDPWVELFEGASNKSKNLKFIGLTIKDAENGVIFKDDYGEVHYCKFYNTRTDSISFDRRSGGTVTHTLVENAGDDAIDIDSVGEGSFLFAYNEFINTDDDHIEIHLWGTDSLLNMHYDIHDNLFSGSGHDGIQLIDYAYDTKRTFDIYRNVFQGAGEVAISSMFEETTENHQGTAMTERVRIYNNYFYNNGYHITGGDNMIILNNIFEAASVTAIKRVKVDSVVDYNLFYGNSIDTEDTLTGGNNLYSNPLRNNDFTLQAGSPAIDAGTAGYTHSAEVVLQIPTTEYTGQNPDMGRYEYSQNSLFPVLTLKGANPMNLDINDTFIDPGAMATDDVDGDITAFIEVDDSNVNTSVAGTYEVTYTVSNSNDNSASITRSVIVSDGAFVFQSRVSVTTDDAEEFQDGNMSLKSSDLEIGISPNRPLAVGLRFTNISIPKNAIISKAYIQFKVDERSLNNADITIHAESAANALGFNGTDHNISSRVKTNTSVSWSPADWNTIGAAAEDQRTSDLSSIVQEVISGAGWESGNPVALILSGTGTRVAESYDGDQAGAPLLYIEFNVPN